MIYLDYNATYPCSKAHNKEVFSILEKCSDGNPSSIHHYGRQSKNIIEEARKNIAQLLGCGAENIFFNSGATEANNTIVYNSIEKNNKKPYILTSRNEHPSILIPLEFYEKKQACSLDFIKVKTNGSIDEQSLIEKLKAQPDLVCIMLVNNEVGSINSLRELSSVIKKLSPKTHIHTDAVQALGKIDLKWVVNSQIDSLSISAHKVGGLKGVGALYLKELSSLKFPLIRGGGQEHSKRAGTENLAGIISFSLQAQAIVNNNPWKPVKNLCQQLEDLLKNLEDIVINSDTKTGSGNTINFYIKEMSIETVLLHCELAGIIISSGSACSSGIAEPSYVLTAMNISSENAKRSIRVSLGPESTISEVNKFFNVIKDLVEKKSKVVS
jgi:cysteine desulfurase